MPITISLTRKDVWLLLDALDHRIASETERYKREDPSDDEACDFGNDLHYLTLMRAELAAIKARDAWHHHVYECWEDPEDDSITLVKFGGAEEHRAAGLMSDKAMLRYSFPAATQEEAKAIHYLRQGFGGYTPMGDVGECPTCNGPYYPMASGDCWRCGNQDEKA